MNLINHDYCRGEDGMVRCDFNLFFVYSNFKPVDDNEGSNGDINESNPYVWLKMTFMTEDMT